MLKDESFWGKWLVFKKTVLVKIVVKYLLNKEVDIFISYCVMNASIILSIEWQLSESDGVRQK